jgi:hypothetical protein
MGEAVDSPYPDIDDNVRYLPAETKESAVGDRELTRDVHILYSRLNKHGTNMVRSEMVMDDSGLGTVPPQLDSIASLLLFNSNINPYKSYQTLDNLESAGKYVYTFILAIHVMRMHIGFLIYIYTNANVERSRWRPRSTRCWRKLRPLLYQAICCRLLVA